MRVKLAFLSSVAAMAIAGHAIAATITLDLDNALDVATGPNGEWIATDQFGDSFSIKAPNQSSQFLAIGLGGQNDTVIPDGLIDSTNPKNNNPRLQEGVGNAINLSSGFDFGANRAPVPSGSDNAVLNPDAFDNPDLGDVPDTFFLPSKGRTGEIEPVASNIQAGGNIAVTNNDGSFNIQNFTIFADVGIVCAQGEAACNDGASNTFLNDKNTTIPNDAATFHPPSNVEAPGVDLNALPEQGQIPDSGAGLGITGDVDFTDGNAPFGMVLQELVGDTDSLGAIVPTLTSTFTLDLTSGLFDGSAGQISSGDSSNDDTLFINLAKGLNVIDIDTGGNDFLLNNANLVIDGDEDSFVIFRFQDFAFNVSNGNILAGSSGIGLNNILFFTQRTEFSGNETFNINNAVLNGVAFHDLGLGGGEITINNAQGCAQFVADKINFNDVRFNRCAFAPEHEVAEPETFGMFGLALAGMLYVRRRRA